MNRRRFLSMLGAIPAALALPALPPVTKRPVKRPLTILVQSPMNDFRSDLQYASIMAEKLHLYLIGEHGPEIFVPRYGGTTL